MTRADLARKLERTPQEITRALNDTKGGAGKVPTLWADIFDALGMELIARVEDTED